MSIYAQGLKIAAWIIVTVALITAIRMPRRLEKQNVGLFLLSIGITILWALAYFMQMNSKQVESAFFWLCAHMVGPIVLPPIWLVLIGRRTGHSHWFPLGIIAALSVIPALSLFFLHMMPWPNPMVANVEMAQSILKVTPGPWYWVHTVYSYLVIAAIVILLIGQVPRLPSQAKKKAILILAAFIGLMSFHVWTQSLLIMLRPNPATLLGAVAFMILVIGMFRHDLLDMGPLPRSQIIETINDGILVLDNQERIVDLNHAAQEILNLKNVLGRPAQETLQAWPSLINPSTTENVLTIHGNGATPRHYAISRIPFQTKSQTGGQIILLRDITPDEKIQQEQQRLAQELHHTIAMVRENQGLLSICAWCGRVQDAQGNWFLLGEWLVKYQILDITHGMCPFCEQQLLHDVETLDHPL